MVSSEYLLVICIIGFYLFDSIMLLYGNEVILTESGGKWNLLFPINNFFILNKALFIPNPLTPYSPLLLLYWTSPENELDAVDSGALDNFIRALRPLKYMIGILFALMIFAVPIILIRYGAEKKFIILLLTVYINILLIISYIGYYRSELNISVRKYILIIVESLICAPYALNILRKLSLNYYPGGYPFNALTSLFNSDIFQSLQASLLGHIDTKIVIEPDDDRRSKLQQIRQTICKLQQ